MRYSLLLLLVVPPVTWADLSFELVVLDRAYLAYERDVGDLDGDGDRDIVAVQEGDTDLQLFRAPEWTRSALLTFTGASRYPRADDLKVADVDGDGDLDVVTRLGAGPADDGPGVVVWCENLERWAYHQVSATHVRTFGLCFPDVDGDGDTDLALAEHRGTRRIGVWENDGRGRFTERRVGEGQQTLPGWQQRPGYHRFPGEEIGRPARLRGPTRRHLDECGRSS